jgi:hypothetical protein
MLRCTLRITYNAGSVFHEAAQICGAIFPTVKVTYVYINVPMYACMYVCMYVCMYYF